MNSELFEAPFNLAGELLDESSTPEGEARVRALADAESRKSQMGFRSMFDDWRRERPIHDIDVELA